jgi:KTSC domain-containing protein
MTPIPLQSSNLKHYTYDDKAHHLDITFHSGKTYRYHGVTPQKLKAFQDAPSKGSHLAKVLIPGHRSEKLA